MGAEPVACLSAPCRACGQDVRLPTPLAKRQFEARGAKCHACAATPEELDRCLTAMILATDWTAVPLDAKLRIAAEVASA